MLSLSHLYGKNRHRNKVRTLFLVDIFRMKDINAAYGFKNGDSVIKQLNKLLRDVIKNDVTREMADTFHIKMHHKITRHHSDVISISFQNDLNQTEILKIKEILTRKIQAQPFFISSPDLKIYINITIGCSKSVSRDLLVYAEKALHDAKQRSERFIFLDANLYKNETALNDLVDIIKYNIEERKIEPYYQAIYSNQDETVVKYEALMRLFDRDGNILYPGTFLEKSRSYRLYVQLMQVLLDKVFNTIIEHRIHISINLDYNDIINPLINSIILSRIQEDDIGRYLTIEILESEKIQNFDIINEFIQEVKKHSVSIAIDDFGTGFSNYEFIVQLNVDYLKIDGSLIKKIDEDIYMNVIKSIIMLCREQNIKIVAEFVSDLKTQRYVKSLGIDYSQGYYIQKPKSIEQIYGESSEK